MRIDSNSRVNIGTTSSASGAKFKCCTFKWY
jgi:hypothetical protein